MRYNISATYVIYKEIFIMTENEIALLTLIRENDNPEKLLTIAIEIVIEFLRQYESSV